MHSVPALRPWTIHRAGLLAVAGLLICSAGCTVTKSQLRPASTCTGCACESCSSALAAAEEKSRMANGESVTSATVELDDEQMIGSGENGPATLAVPPLPVPPETSPEMMPPTQLALPEAPVRDIEARQECAQLQQQTDALRGQLQSLETYLQQEQMKQQALRQSLASVNSKVSALSGELHYWKQEVKRIDQEAEEQHRQDMQSLQTISELISRLPRPATVAGETPTRY